MIDNKDKKTTHLGYSRREFIKASGLAAGAVGTLAASSLVQAKGSGIPKGVSKKLSITMAGYKYNRVAALVDGRVKIEGCDVNFELGKIGNMNTDVFRGAQTRDVTEIGLHPFMLAYANGDFRDYTLLPIFLLRVFRHKSVFIRSDRGIDKPEDLRGKAISMPGGGYSSSSLTWMRGIFEDEYGLKPQDIQWVTASKDSSASVAGTLSKQETMLPNGISVKSGSPGKDESDMLVSGEVDAVFHAAEPRAFTEGHPKVRRLFLDSRAAERAYYKKTGVFPIMHAVAIKNDTLKQNPWLAEAVFNAYSRAKQLDYKLMTESGWYMDSLPWYGQELADTRALMGNNFYSYGIRPNRKALETICRYSYRQGLSNHELTIEELFAPASLEFVESLA